MQISNNEIYLKLVEIEKFMRKLDGRVVVNKWISTTALTMALLIMAAIIGGIL